MRISACRNAARNGGPAEVKRIKSELVSSVSYQRPWPSRRRVYSKDHVPVVTSIGIIILLDRFTIFPVQFCILY